MSRIIFLLVSVEHEFFIISKSDHNLLRQVFFGVCSHDRVRTGLRST